MFKISKRKTKKNDVKLIHPNDIARIRKSAKKVEKWQNEMNGWLRRCNRLPLEEVKEIEDFLTREYHDYFALKDARNTVKNMINALPTKKQVLLKYDFGYKFSKSKPEYTKYFAENHYIRYVDKDVAIAKDGYLSFLCDKEDLLKYITYGDQVTRFSFSPDHPYYPVLINAEMTAHYGTPDETASSALPIDKNFTLSDPHVLKAVMSVSEPCRKNIEMIYWTLEKRKVSNRFLRNSKIYYLRDVYKALGFDRTAKVLDDLEPYVKREKLTYKDILTVLDDMLPEKDDIFPA